MKQLSSPQLAARLNRMGAAQWFSLKQALHLAPGHPSPMIIERFANDPEHNPIDAKLAEFLQEFIMGNYALNNSTGEMIRIRVEPGPAVVLQRPAAGPLRHTPFSPVGQGVVNGGITEATNKGADIPDAETRKMNARKQQDREAMRKPTLIQQTRSMFGADK